MTKFKVKSDQTTLVILISNFYVNPDIES